MLVFLLLKNWTDWISSDIPSLAERVLVLAGLFHGGPLHAFGLLSKKERVEGVTKRTRLYEGTTMPGASFSVQCHYSFQISWFCLSDKTLTSSWENVVAKLLSPFPIKKVVFIDNFSGSGICQNRLVRKCVREIWLWLAFQGIAGTDIANRREMKICPALFFINRSPHPNLYMYFFQET